MHMRDPPPTLKDKHESQRFKLLVGVFVATVVLLGVLVLRHPTTNPAIDDETVDAAEPAENHARITPRHAWPSVQNEWAADDDDAPANAPLGVASVAGLTTGTWMKVKSKPRVSGEWPIFAALRASLGQPVPPEVAALAREITRNCKTNAERARALYDWTTAHITYDWKVWADIVAGAGTYTEPQDPLSVIRRGTAVCAGYAWLYDAFASSVGLSATFVIGDVRGYRGTADDELISKYKHAWNCVNIDGAWTLLDATWGAQQAGEAVDDYLPRRDYYFATPASQLIYDHLPESPAWQVLSDPVADNDFHTQPNLKPAFFTNDLKLGEPDGDTLHTTTDQLAGITLTAPEEMIIAATLSDTNGAAASSKLTFRIDGDRRSLFIAPLPAGDYLLRLYVKCATNASRFACCADFAVSVAPADAGGH